MLDGRQGAANSAANGDNRTLDYLEKMQDRAEFNCLKLARYCKIEELAMSAFINNQNTLVQMEDVNTVKLRKETQQLLRLINTCGIYFMVLCVVYLFQTSVCYSQLDEQVFNQWTKNEHYGYEMFNLVSTVCLINIVHALTLLSMALFVVLFTRKFKVLNNSHYMQLGVLTLVITLVYFLPIAIIAGKAFSDSQTSERAHHKGGATRFFDIVLYILMKSEQGVGGFLLAVVIHFQLYMLIFTMMWCASHIKEIAERMQKLQDSQAGTYRGLELRGVDQTQEERKSDESVSLEKVSDVEHGTEPQITLAEDQDQLIEETQPITGDLLDTQA